MAYNKFDVPAPTVALVGTTAKTVVGLKASANVCVLVTEVMVSFDGATNTNAPAVCEFVQSTFATNAPGTNSTSVTLAKRDTGRAETVQAAAAKNWTTEPTVLTQQWAVDVAQYFGIYHLVHPFASPFVVAGGQGCAIRITSPNNCNTSCKLSAEE